MSIFWNRHERQQGHNCSAYAAAFVLRSLGQEAGGAALYTSIGFRLDNGFVLPQGIVALLAEHGVTAALYTGTPSQLKARLTAGYPVIVLVGDGFSYQHHVALVGYDTEYLYFFDSNREALPGEHYNWAPTESEFLAQWDNGIPSSARPTLSSHRVVQIDYPLFLQTDI